MQLAALVGYELLVVILRRHRALACLVSASVAGIFTRLSRGRLGRRSPRDPLGRPPSAR